MTARGPLWRRVLAGVFELDQSKPFSLCDETPEAGRWQPRSDTPVADAVQREMAQLLLERDTETQRADDLDRQLRAARARIRGLEDTVRAYAAQALTNPPVGAVRIADDELPIQPLPGEVGR